MNGDIKIVASPFILPQRTNGSQYAGLYRFSITGARRAMGRAVVFDLAKINVILHCDRAVLDYDFSRFSVFDPPREGQTYKPAVGKPLMDIVRDYPRAIFACNGETDDMWATCSAMVINGETITRKAPGILCDRFYPAEGSLCFFVLDRDKFGLNYVYFKDGKPKLPVPFRNGIRGFPLIGNKQNVSGMIKEREKDKPNILPHESIWNPNKRESAMSAVAKIDDNKLMFVSFAGDPGQYPEPRLDDLVKVLKQFDVTDALLLGMSGDVQQFVMDDNNPFLIAKPRTGSSKGKMNWENGRPIQTAIIVTSA